MTINKNNSGIILLSVLWILAILSLLAMSLGKNSSLEFALVRGAVGKLKAYAAARSGISYTQNLLSTQKTTADTLFECGVKLPENKAPKDLYSNIKVGKDAHFDIIYPAIGYSETAKTVDVYGVSDEQGKLNLNSLTQNNWQVLSELLQEFEVKKADAETIALNVANWHQQNLQDPSKTDGLKHMPFDHIEELLMIEGMTLKVFNQIKHYVTVFPKDVEAGNMQINYNTASNPVIKAVVKSSGQGADNYYKNMINSRDGADHLPFTDDDGKLVLQSASEAAFSNTLSSNMGITASEFFNIRSVGTDEATGVTAIVNALVQRKTDGNLSIVAWNRE
jgi:type II secretory pathway component PulK